MISKLTKFIVVVLCFSFIITTKAQPYANVGYAFGSSDGFSNFQFNLGWDYKLKDQLSFGVGTGLHTIQQIKNNTDYYFYRIPIELKYYFPNKKDDPNYAFFNSFGFYYAILDETISNRPQFSNVGLSAHMGMKFYFFNGIQATIKGSIHTDINTVNSFNNTLFRKSEIYMLWGFNINKVIDKIRKITNSSKRKDQLITPNLN